MTEVEPTFEALLSKVERMYRARVKEIAKLEAQCLRIPNKETQERVTELRGYSRGLLEIYALAASERAEVSLF